MRPIALAVLLLLAGCDGPLRLWRTEIRFPASSAVVILYCGPDLERAEAHLVESRPKDRPGLRLTLIQPAATCAAGGIDAAARAGRDSPRRSR